MLIKYYTFSFNIRLLAEQKSNFFEKKTLKKILESGWWGIQNLATVENHYHAQS